MEQSIHIVLFIIYLHLIFSLYFIIKPECHRDSMWSPFYLVNKPTFSQISVFSTFEPNVFEHGEKQYDFKTVPGCCMCKPLP